MKKILIITSVILFSITLTAQENGVPIAEVLSSRASGINSFVKRLVPGDKMPDLPIGKMVNAAKAKKPSRISDFNNKLLILDFMDTRCGSCIEALPRLDTLQQQFGDKISIYPVTWEKQAYLQKWLETNTWYKKHHITFPWIAEDTLLSAYFKHKVVSHIAWIYQGEVKAITEKEYITAKNIQTILDGKKVTWAVKNDDYYFDIKQPVFTLLNSDAYNKESGFFNYSGLTGYRQGIDNSYLGGITYDSSLNRTYFYNLSIADAYSILWYQLLRPKSINFNQPGRMILEVKNPSDYRYDPKMGYADAWNQEHEFCYEMLSTRHMDKKEWLHKIVEDLNLRLGLNGRMEKRLVKCLVLVQAPGGAHPDTTQRPVGSMKMPVSTIPLMCLDIRRIYPPAFDETNYKGFVYINSSFNDLEDLRKQLRANGFDLIEAERETEVLVITENDFKK